MRSSPIFQHISVQQKLAKYLDRAAMGGSPVISRKGEYMHSGTFLKCQLIKHQVISFTRSSFIMLIGVDKICVQGNG